MKSIKHPAVLAGAMLMAGQNAFALEEFFNAPGTRALSMGGAFAAVAADTSAIFYNPAGLGFLPKDSSDFTVEFGDVLEARDRPLWQPGDIYESDRQLKYLGFSSRGFGLAYFTPYEFYTDATSNVNNATYQVRTDYREFKFGFGGQMNENFALGGTIDYVTQSTSSNCPNCEESENELGFGATVGGLIKQRLDEASKLDLQLAAVYRTKTEVDVVLGEFEDLPNRPQTTTFGAALKRPFTLGDWAVFATVAAQKDALAYDKVLYVSGTTPVAVDHDRTSFGGEFQFISPTNQSYFFRVGKYESSADGDADPTTGFEEFSSGVEGTTLGFGIVLNDWVLDYARESRTVEMSQASSATGAPDQKETMNSISFSRVF